MADEETVSYFRVKNTSIRLVNFGGMMIPPENVVDLIDDKEGINRATIEQDVFLEETDEDLTVKPQVEGDAEEKAVAPKRAARKTTANSASTPTGAGWNSSKS